MEMSHIQLLSAGLKYNTSPGSGTQASRNGLGPVTPVFRSLSLQGWDVSPYWVRLWVPELPTFLLVHSQNVPVLGAFTSNPAGRWSQSDQVIPHEAGKADKVFPSHSHRERLHFHTALQWLNPENAKWKKGDNHRPFWTQQLGGNKTLYLEQDNPCFRAWYWVWFWANYFSWSVLFLLPRSSLLFFITF